MTGSSRGSRLERFLDVLQEASSVAVVTHDNPDPDAIASGWGIVVLVEQALGCPAKVYAGGAINRAENRTFVDLLKPPLELVDELTPEPSAKIVVVDTVSPARLRDWDPTKVLAAVIDHHHHEAKLDGGGRLRYRFRDIRPQVVASSSMVSGYLKEMGVTPSAALATGLLYGVHTDSQGHDVKFSRVDRSAIAWLAQYSDPGLRSRIERAPLPRFYFQDMVRALENTFIFGDSAICFLAAVTGSEVVGEVADLLLRCQGVNRVLCGAVVDGRMVFSARTSDSAGSAAELLRRALGKIGSSGGHTHRAGGHIVLAEAKVSLTDIEARVKIAWLAACGIQERRSMRLVSLTRPGNEVVGQR